MLQPLDDTPTTQSSGEEMMEYIETNVLKMRGELFVAKTVMFESVKAHDWLFVLSNRALYKFRTHKIQQPRKRVDLMDIHSVVASPDDGRVFDVYTYKSKTRFELNKIFGSIGLARMNFDSFLQHRRYQCANALECAQYVYILQCLIRSLWQTAAETSVVPTPEVYQRHVSVIKMHGRGFVKRSQDRLLVLSTQWLYNMEISHRPTSLSRSQLRWALPVSAVREITITDGVLMELYVDMEEVKRQVDDEHLGSKGYNINARHHFLMHAPQECSIFCFELRRLVAAECGRVIDVTIKTDGYI